eukprot:gene3113-3390_t
MPVVYAKLADGAAAGKMNETELKKARQAAQAAVDAESPAGWVDRFQDKPRKGCDILVQALEREGVDTVFAYPGGASMEIHQALTRSETIQNILCRHEQGEIFAAEGYAKTTGRVGVCIATSGPGATNLVTGLADAMMDSVALVAITGQETPIVEVTRAITKHNYLVMDIADLPRVIKEAFYLARTGRPGPVLVDVPKDIQQQLDIPDWDTPMAISGYMSRLPPPPEPARLAAVIKALKGAKKPVVYLGGGCLDAAPEVREFVAKTQLPVAQTLMGLGAFPVSHPLSLQMLGMHGTVYANYAVDQLESFATHARIVHIDIDPAEIHKNKHAHIPICAAVSSASWAELDEQKAKFPMGYPDRDDVIAPQHAVQVLHEETKGEAIITTGVGQHQMFAAQWYPLPEPRRWATSGGLGSMGFGLPSALGAAAAFDGKDGRPSRVVVDIDGDGSFLMNCQASVTPQELATAAIEKLNIKILLLNNQHLGMVVQWEDRFYKVSASFKDIITTGDGADQF